MIVLKKGTPVYLGQKGHNNFYYPSEERETLLEDTTAQQLPWVGGGEKIAFKIPAKSVQPTQPLEKNMFVWVKKPFSL
jgi:hypothetical protein